MSKKKRHRRGGRKPHAPPPPPTTLPTDPPPETRAERWLEWLRQPVDGASLATFRFFLGVIMLIDVWRYWDKIYYIWIHPPFSFKFYGFEWVKAWPGDGMYYHFIVMGIAAALIALGLFYRIACVAFFLLFTYMFLIEQAIYLNHFYMVCLLAFLMCWLPADRAWALGSGRYPRSQRGTVPRWAPLAVMLFMEVLLIYAGVVKINADWLQGHPLKMWFYRRAHYDIIGPLLEQEWFALAGSYGAIALHLVGAPLLFFRKTRLWAFLAYVVFHLSNALIWTIGIFPFVTIAGTLIFFDPDWPRKLVRKVAPKLQRIHEPPELIPVKDPAPLRERVAIGVIGVFLAYNVLMPMRPLLYPRDVAWTEEGHRFSWRMKLRDKHGNVTFKVRDPRTKQGWDVTADRYLTSWQIRQLAAHPDMLLQFAHHLAEIWKRDYKVPDPQVFARSYVSLNGRPPAPLVDPTHDLAATERNLWPADWILGLDPDLKPGKLDLINEDFGGDSE